MTMAELLVLGWEILAVVAIIWAFAGLFRGGGRAVTTRSERWQRYRKHRESFGLSKRAIDREVVFAKIIESWNDEGRHYGGWFDCGELGIAYIRWIRGWEVQWGELEALPDGIGKEEE